MTLSLFYPHLNTTKHKHMEMNINPRIKEIFQERKIDEDSGILILLGYYFGLDIDKVTDTKLVTSVNHTKIVERDYSTVTIENPIGSLKWNIPLFLQMEIEFDWVSEWMKPFKQKNPNRGGVLSYCQVRMKKFFSRNPSIRVEDVFKATKAYLDSVNDYAYLKSPHKFIYEGQGTTEYSMLLEWVEKTKIPDKAENGINTELSHARGKLL